jgi:hypothetical protein
MQFARIHPAKATNQEADNMTQTTLPEFEGQTVHKAALRIINAGDGLSEALELEPQALHMGDEVCFVLKGKVSQVNHKEGKDNAVIRLHTVSCSGIAAIDQETAETALTGEAERLAKLRDERDGQQRIDDEPAV